MIVEFVGPPGAGKTTIARELAEQMGQSSLTLDGYRTGEGRILSPWEVRFYRLWSLVLQPQFVYEALKCLRSEGRGLALSWVFNLARRNHMMRSMRGRNIILEEGTLSALCLAQAARSSRWGMLSLLPLLTHGHRVVLIDIESETAVERIVKRRGILSDQEPSELIRLVDGYKTALGELAPALNPAPIVVSSGQPPSVAAEFVAELLRNGPAERLDERDRE